MASCKPFQKIQPFHLLAQLAACYATGCLQVFSGSVSWSIYLEQGKLTYAWHSVDPFERLDRHLHRLSYQIPTLVRVAREQVRLLFENHSVSQPIQNHDYRAICWLVNQQRLNSSQAATLIEGLVKEVIETFLLLEVGHYELVEQHQLDGLPKFCTLEVQPLVEYCQRRLQYRRPSFGGGARAQQQAESAQQSVIINSNTAITNTATPFAKITASPEANQTIDCSDQPPKIYLLHNSWGNSKKYVRVGETMTYEQVKHLSPEDFKRLFGYDPETFAQMVEVVRSHTKPKQKLGRPSKLSLEDQVLMTLDYWREYRTYFQIAKSWGVHESTAYRIIRRIEDTLIKSRVFTLAPPSSIE